MAGQAVLSPLVPTGASDWAAAAASRGRAYAQAVPMVTAAAPVAATAVAAWSSSCQAR
ncbi:hypothetical protein [Streptomyces durocortorensis]|uniref:hypothetical protein n=1 Tax=Streptomyces durocortorensis TaxID=2811104 RepID=UPI001960F50A|nr:hypothetical protein [Streptomyces durocortorensis]